MVKFSKFQEEYILEYRNDYKSGNSLKFMADYDGKMKNASIDYDEINHQLREAAILRGAFHPGFEKDDLVEKVDSA